jgi:hypothetical protein
MRGWVTATAIGAALVGTGAALYLARSSSATEVLRAPHVTQVDVPPVCPWRSPEADMRRFYPGTHGYRSERLSLSSHVLALTRRLGRRPASGELSLDRYAIEPGAQGRVLIRRVSGEYGAIELLLALDGAGRVRGMRLQRLREPEPVARYLESSAWQSRFAGLGAADLPPANADLKGVPAAARVSASAIAEGVRTLLILDDEAGAGAPVHVHIHGAAQGAPEKDAPQ